LGILLITGKSGQLGSSAWGHFHANGWTCIEVLHSHNYGHYVIPEVNSDERVILIHSGQPKAPRSKAQRSKYLSSSRQLLFDAKARNIEIYFISSLSAHKGNWSHYSKDKKSLEKTALELGGSVLKFGLVESRDANSPYIRILKLYSFLSKLRVARLIPVNTYFVSELPMIARLYDLILKSPQIPPDITIQNSLLCDVLVKRNVPVSRELSPGVAALIKIPLLLLSSVGSGSADLALNLISGMAVESEVGRFN